MCTLIDGASRPVFVGEAIIIITNRNENNGFIKGIVTSIEKLIDNKDNQQQDGSGDNTSLLCDVHIDESMMVQALYRNDIMLDTAVNHWKIELWNYFLRLSLLR